MLACDAADPCIVCACALARVATHLSRCLRAEKAVIVHVSVAPLVLTLMADSEANVGLLQDAVPQLSAAVEPLQAAMAGRPTS